MQRVASRSVRISSLVAEAASHASAIVECIVATTCSYISYLLLVYLCSMCVRT